MNWTKFLLITMKPIRLLLIDDHAVMRAGLANMLNSVSNFQVIAESDDAWDGIDKFREHHPDVTLLDVSMPGVDGIKALCLLRQEFPNARVLMLSSSDMEEDIVQSMKAGAFAYISKSARPSDLIAAIQAIHNGKRAFSPEIMRRINEHASSAPLTPREIEVLQLLRKGLSNPEIGDILGISRRTAKAHVAAILDKMEAADRTEAVTRAFERGLLKL